MEKFCVHMAGLGIGMESLYPYARDFCRDYLWEGTPEFTVSSDEKALEAELANPKRPITVFYADTLCLLRGLVEKLPFYDRFFFHGAAVTYGGRAFLFTGPSGTGKTTHVRLWQKYLGEDRVKIINGDKNIIYAGEETKVCSTPWAGKERWQENREAPLGAICFLEQAKENRIRRLSPEDAVEPFLYQLYLPKTDESRLRLIGLSAVICKRIPVYVLSCDMSEDAVKTSFEALTGERYSQK